MSGPSASGEPAIPFEPVDFIGTVFGRHLSPEIVRRYANADEIHAVLQEASKSCATATVCGAHVPCPIQGKLVEAHRDRVVLEFEGSQATSVGDRSLCTVIFTHNQHQCMFFSVVITSGPNDSGGTRLIIRPPAGIDEVEARWNRRLKLTNPERVAVSVSSESGHVLSARIVDIGRGGCDLAISSPYAPDFAIGQHVCIGFRDEFGSVELSAQFRWRSGGRCGFCFSHYSETLVFNVPGEFEELLQRISSAQEAA